MAFNALDYVLPDEARFRALREIRRVLETGRILIFSSHNPRSILGRRIMESGNVCEIWRRRIAQRTPVFFPPLFGFLIACARRAGSVALNGAVCRCRAREDCRRSCFGRARAIWTDPAHGGLKTPLCGAGEVEAELAGIWFHVAPSTRG